MVRDCLQAKVSSDESRPSVAVYGASGHTGRFVVAELRRRGWQVVACGRDAQKLQTHFGNEAGVQIRTASIERPDSLHDAFSGAVAVINCAGPFLDTAEPIIRAALQRRIPYLDLSAEQRATLASFEQFSEAAREAGIVVLPSMAFYGGLADLLATAAMGDWKDADAIRIAVGLDGWHPTQGTRLTGKRNTYRRYVLSESRLEFLTAPAPKLRWHFPAPLFAQEVVGLPFSEVIVISRHLRVSNIESFINLAPLHDLHDPNTPEPTAVDNCGRSAQKFVMDLTVRRGDDIRRACASGQDIYAISAPLVSEALDRLLTMPVRVSATVAPGEIFNARDFLQALTPSGLAVEFR